MTLCEQLRTTWLEAGISVNDGASQTRIEAFERTRNITLPTAFKNYLLTVNGMKDGEIDEHFISFLSIDAIDQEDVPHQLSTNEIDIVFAEFLIYSHYYVLRFTRSGEEISILAGDGEHEKTLANCFDECVSLYLRDPIKMAKCWV
jgi:hypothetical protein